MATRARLPGVRFETVPPPPADVLPRTDVAAFVGFAASGPLHLPVPVEDPAAFADVFGADAPLAWDAARGELLFAHLGPAVRAFFRNGGRRCWVVRTAGEAVGNAFPIPGLMSVTEDGSLVAATAPARSEGSWSDGVCVAATLESELISVKRPIDVPGRSLTLRDDAPPDVRPGDLLRLTYPTGDELLFPVRAVELVQDETEPAPRTVRVVRWKQAQEVRFPPEATPGGNPTRVERLTFELWVRQGESVRRLGGLGFDPEHPRFWGALPTDAQLFGDDDRPARYADLWAEVASPRFPLAGRSAGLSVPVAIPRVFDPEAFHGPDQEPSPETSLARDGLADYRPGLFLGADDVPAQRCLVGASAGQLLAEADFLRWTGPAPRRLRGIYAALGIEEATLIAVPDAVHRGWEPSPPAPIPPDDSPPPPPQPPPACPVWDFVACEPAVAPPPPAVKPAAVDPTAPRPYWQAKPVAGFQPDTLFAVQRALLRLCAARGDLFAVLALPEHYREDDAVRHRAGLSYPAGLRFDLGGSVESVPLGAGETAALSFGAVYHPWLLGREENDPVAVRRVPPDGAACGVMAKRAVARGPWVAPANEPLRGVVGLIPDVHPDRRLDLQEARVNLVRREPRGFLTLSADTLSPDDDLREINVRRLLILLRRLALRVGADYVFEPHSPAFRRSVRRGFEEVMRFLFARGAFAGRAPAEAFRVIVDDTVNPAEGVERGRFVVELRVAPSRPLTFLTVRLVQTGERGSVTEGG